MSTDERLLAEDRAARRAALDTARSFIVQAPAGSGKTELLIQRYLGLLGTVAHPEEIIAITFTRKAASEMRVRVLEALRAAAAGHVPEEEHRQVTARAAKKVCEEDLRRGWNLESNPGRMRIMTLDALNAAVVRMLPVTAAGGGAGSTIADEHGMNTLYRRAAAATLDWLGEDSDEGASARRVLEHLDGNSAIYIAYLARMLQTRDQWLPFMGGGEIDADRAGAMRTRFEGLLAGIIRQRLEALRDAFPAEMEAELIALLRYAGDNLQEAGKVDNPACGFAGNSLPGSGPQDVDGWRAIAELVLTGSGSVRKQVNVRQGFPPGDDGGRKASMHGLLETVAGKQDFVAALARVRELPPANYSDDQWDVLLALFRLLPLATAELRRLCLEQGETDYTEVAISASRALGSAEEPGDLALLLDYQVRHILVDEMQDTSRAQYRMLESLTGGWTPGDGRTLFCVGDPMQSIYRFRNADVAQFLVAARNGIGSQPLEPLVLRQNFRSGERLVDWFNRVFPDVLPGRSEPLSGAVAYSAAVPAEHLAGQGEVRVHPVFGTATADEAKQGAVIVAELLDADPDASVAVLVRGRTRLPDLLRELRAAGVPYQAVDIDRLTDLPEILDLLALTRAFTHEADRVAWLGLLRAPWVGLDWQDIHALVRDSGDRTVPELVSEPGRLEALSATGRRAVARAWPVIEENLRCDRSLTLHRRVEKAWFQLGGPATVADANGIENVYRYLDALARLEHAGTLGDVAELMDQLDAERVSATTPARVQIMTMHKSKGLQFDHVVLYGLGRYSGSSAPSVMSWIDVPTEGGGEEPLMSPVRPREWVDPEPLHRFIEATDKEKSRYEDGRLLYVACTRARRSLHLVGHVRVTDDGEACKPPDSRSLLYLLWPHVRTDFERALSGAFAPSGDNPESAFENPPLRRFAGDWELPAPPLPAGRHGQPAELPAAPRIEYDWVGFEARLAGTVVHRWLQYMADSSFLYREADEGRIAARTRGWLRELGAGEKLLGPVTRRVLAVLESVAADATGRWLLAGPGESELPLTGIIDGRLESVVIDRVRIDEEGTHWVVDYKTSTHEGGDLAGFLDAERERYRAQLSRYATIYRNYSGCPARCALYYPLLGAFVEVEPDAQ
jgi:ATP-dependent helicase/nuclease subunit A